jgi:predicted Zn-dependent peptidase
VSVLPNDFAPERSELPSGLTLLVSPMPNVRRVVLSLYLRTGSRFESPAILGLSHFLEHMLFRGTNRHPDSHTLASAFEDLGGTLNASTAADHGTLSIAVPLESLDATIALLAEVVCEPRLQDLEVERNIIREEILEELDDDGNFVDALGVGRSLLFGGHPLGAPITGTLDSLSKLNEQDLRRHHAATYVGVGMVLSIAGPVDQAHVTATVARHFSALPRGSILSAGPSPSLVGRKCRVQRHAGESQTRLYVGFHAFGHHAPADAATEMLLRVLDDGMSTRVYQRLCDQSGLCYDAFASYEAWEDAGVVEFVADTAHDRAPKVLEAILDLCEELTAHGPTEAEWARAQRRARWQHDALLDDPHEVADYLAFAALAGVAPSPKMRLDELLAVERRQVIELAGALFVPDRRAVVAVGLPSAPVTQKLENLASRR